MVGKFNSKLAVHLSCRQKIATSKNGNTCKTRKTRRLFGIKCSRPSKEGAKHVWEIPIEDTID